MDLKNIILIDLLKKRCSPKLFWNNVSSARTGSQSELTTLKVDDITLANDLDIAETMNSYFSTMFASEDYANFPEYDNIVDLQLSNIHCNTNEV